MQSIVAFFVFFVASVIAFQAPGLINNFLIHNRSFKLCTPLTGVVRPASIVMAAGGPLNRPRPPASRSTPSKPVVSQSTQGASVNELVF